MQNNREQIDSRIATLSYSASLGKAGSFTLSALRNMTNTANTTVFAMLSISLDSSISASISSQSILDGNAANSNDITTTLQRNLPSGEGYGYHLQARSDGYKEASYSLQNNIGTYTIDAAQSQGSIATRLDAAGGMALFGGRRILESQYRSEFRSGTHS